MFGKNKQTKERIPYSLFLVTLPKSIDNKEIYGLNYLLSYRVQVEQYRPKEILQCYLCLRLGHSKKTCFCTPVCVKCCGGDHPANYRGCETFKRVLEQRRAQRDKITSTTNPESTKTSNNKTTVSATTKTTQKQSSPTTNNRTANLSKTTTSSATKDRVSLSKTKPQQFSSPKTSDQQQPKLTDNTDTNGFSLSNLSEFGTTIQTIYNQFKRLFQGLNIMKILTRVQQGLSKLTPDPGLLTTLSTVVQIIASVIDDGTE